jgi:hypothetical protein
LWPKIDYLSSAVISANDCLLVWIVGLEFQDPRMKGIISTISRILNHPSQQPGREFNTQLLQFVCFRKASKTWKNWLRDWLTQKQEI